MKYRLNRGKRPGLYFFRDTHGNEVDLLIREQGKLFPVEIKSSATFSRSFLKEIERFRSLTSNCRADGAVLYNGDQQFQVKNVHIFNLLKYQAELKSLFFPTTQEFYQNQST